MPTLVTILLAGGVGSRLWPLSREFYPKQLLHLTGQDSLLQQAARRALEAASPSHVVTVTAEAHFFTVLDQLREVDPRLCDHLLAEPTSRGTAAAATLAALYAREHFEDPILWIAPADPVIGDANALDLAVELAARAAAWGDIVALGLPDARPHWGLDAIHLGPPRGVMRPVTGYEAGADPAALRGASQAGEVAWNSGMVVASAARLLEVLEASAPDVLASVRAAWSVREQGRVPLRVPRASWAEVPARSLGEVLLEDWQGALVLGVDPGWSDVGTWMGLWESEPKDADGNAVLGDVLLERSRNCLVRSDGRLVACAGVQDLAIVETADAILVAHREEAASVTAIVRRLREAHRSEATNHLKDLRPWGSFSILLEGPRYKIKEIVVNPGASLSLQMHYHRAEHWVVIEGTARVTRDGEVLILSENQSTYIPLGTRHRLENPGRVPLRIIEVQNGTYLGEDDIVRFEDAYGRDG